MKLQSKSLFFLLAGCIYVLACQGKKSETTAEPATAPETSSSPATASNAEGKKTFDTYCILCHGADGKLGLNGSKDLSISILTTAERIDQVTNGKGLMTPFKEILTEAEISAVVNYTESLIIK